MHSPQCKQQGWGIFISAVMLRNWSKHRTGMRYNHTDLWLLKSYSLGPSLLAIAAITAGKSLAPSSICYTMQEHVSQFCGHQQNPQNSAMPSWNTACVAIQRCTAHHEVTMHLGISMHTFCHHSLEQEILYLRHYLGLYARVHKGSIHKKWCWCETVFSPGSSLIKTHPGIEADNIFMHKNLTVEQLQQLNVG